jgi:TetR/AcrR family transcriptional repressor of nem operon
MPRDGTPTRTRILDAAERLMLDQGFAATSVDEVIEASASSKGAFFHHFPTKNDLGRALLRRYATADVDALWAVMAHAEDESDDPAEQIVAFVRLFEERGDDIAVANQSSCLYVSFVHDRQLTVDGTTEVIVDAIVTWREAIRAKLVEAFRDRPAGSAIDPDALADHIFVTFEGAFILARATGDSSHMRAQLRVLRQLLEVALGLESDRPARASRATAAG